MTSVYISGGPALESLSSSKNEKVAIVILFSILHLSKTIWNCCLLVLIS